MRKTKKYVMSMQYLASSVILIIEEASGAPKAASISSLNSMLGACSMKLVDSMNNLT